jgi:glycosyltransferase involved in cell wall biosynthesis
MRIIMTTDVVGGVWDFCRVLTSELTAGGHGLTLLAFGRPTVLQQEQAAEAGAELLHEDLKLEWMADSASDVHRSQLRLLSLAEELQPDIVHVNQYALASLNLCAPIVLTAHSDVLSWHKWTAHVPAGPEWAPYAALCRGGLLGADSVVAVSGFLAREVADLYGIDREIGVIHNGWPAEDRPARKRGLSLLAGRAWDRAKNIELAARALAGWDAGEVAFAGPTAHPESGGVMPLGGRLQVLGALPQRRLLELLAQARVYVSPARYDPFGLLPLQAALAGCALLLSDIPSYRELWDGAAAFFPPDSETDLRRLWQRLLEDDELARSLASQARQRAAERFSSGEMAARYLALYERLRTASRAGAGAA